MKIFENETSELKLKLQIGYLVYGVTFIIKALLSVHREFNIIIHTAPQCIIYTTKLRELWKYAKTCKSDSLNIDEMETQKPVLLLGQGSPDVHCILFFKFQKWNILTDTVYLLYQNLG